MSVGRKRIVLVTVSALALAGIVSLFAVTVRSARSSARVDSLVSALASEGPEAAAARDRLIRLRSRSEIERLMEAFLDKNERIRSQIPDIIAGIGPSAAPVIADAMMREARPSAMSVWEYYAYVTNGPRSSGWYWEGLIKSARGLENDIAEHLLNETLSESTVRRGAAVAALAWLGGGKALSAVTRFLNDDSVRVRYQLALGFQRNGRAEALAPLMHISFEPEPHEGHETTTHAHPECQELYLAVTAALRRIAADPANAPACVALLKDPMLSPLFRVQIITGLGDAHDPALIDELVPFLSHSDKLTRAAAARALPPDERTNRALAAALADGEPSVVASANGYFDIKAHPGMVTALVEAYAGASDPAHRAAIVKALTGVRDGRHNDYPAPPSSLVAQLRKEAAAALDKLRSADGPSQQPGVAP